MEIRVLKYSITVVREGSFSKAAQKLFITQPTLSRQIKALEDEVGARLIARANNGLTLTSAGLTFYQKAKEIVEFSDRLEEEMRRDSEYANGLIRIGSVESAGADFFFNKLSDFIKQNPNISYDIYNSYTDDILKKMEDGFIDLAVLTEPVALEEYGFISLPEKDKWGLLVSNDSELSKKDEIDWSELSGIPVLLPYRFSKNHDVPNFFANAPENLNVLGTFSLFSNAVHLVENGVASAPCLQSVYEANSNRDVGFVKLYPELETGSLLVWRKETSKKKPGKLLLDFLLENI